MRERALQVALAVAVWPSAAAAAIIVNDPLPISRLVTVEIVQTALDNGTSPATVFGNATQRAAIEAAIDTIWAQAGIDVEFLSNVVRYNSTFAYQGTSGGGTRSSGDLTQIINGAAAYGGILNPDPLVLNLFFVNVVPGFGPLSENTAAGIARVAANGIAAFTGDNLLTFNSGREVIASVIAHEIGHNLGLNHTASGGANLMSPQGTTEQLTSSQINTALATTNFARPVPMALAGDYNGNGVVDAADYTVWRDTLGQTGSGLAADGNHNGRIDTGDSVVWTSNFGESGGAGGGVAANAAPEPGAAAHVLAAALAVVLVRRRDGGTRCPNRRFSANRTV
jgi:hypothetical protein